MSAIEIHKHKELQLCLRTLLLRADSTVLIWRYLNGVHDDSPTGMKVMDLIQLMRDECGCDEQFTIDQLYGIVEMLNSIWVKADSSSEDLEYSPRPTFFNVLLHFVDQGTLKIKDNTNVICHWDSLLRWHTLSSAIGEDLLVCAYLASHDLKNLQVTRTRNDFAWPSYLRTDDPMLEAMLEMPLADIHSHLQGSSLNFDINWICLMNHIDGRVGQFKKLTGFKQGTHQDSSSYLTLYWKAAVAAAIRLYITQISTNDTLFSVHDLESLMSNPADETMYVKVNLLQQSLNTALESIGRLYYNNETGETARFDYAIRDGVTVPRGKQETCAYSLLSGERHILYSTLRGIYRGDYNDGRVEFLFHIYLLIKNEIRHEINQLNDSAGFANFGIYEERKLIFATLQPYKKAAIHLAVASFFGDSPVNNRYHETRIKPKVSDKGKDNVVEKNIAEIDFNDKAIEDGLFKTLRGKDNIQWPYRYIYHFIKQPDVQKNGLEVVPRHYELRKEIKEQAKGIYELRNSLRTNTNKEYYADRVVGIDAANSEIACRPEVFAQAFRYLRKHIIRRREVHCPADLGITYHVGEDFLDVIDGLRAVDEAMRFLQLQKGDRIGHGLVLGIEVDDYYQIRNCTSVLSLQMQMDNAAWLWNRLTKLGLYEKTRAKLKERYGRCFRRVYPHYQGTPDIDLYNSSMLLRGDNPECYDINGKVSNSYNLVDEWGSKNLVRTKTCDDARKQREACKLFYLYHYDKEGKQNGNVYDTWKVDEEMREAIKAAQQDLLKEVEEIGISIECNPTSNYKIGDIENYANHPIEKFNTIKGQNKYPKRDISVSINTDDKGVFATSIEREYALIAHALIRKYREDKGEVKYNDVYEWLDRIRQNSISQRFDKSVVLTDNTKKKTLSDLKNIVRREIEDEIVERRFVDRLIYSMKLLFGKRNS